MLYTRIKIDGKSKWINLQLPVDIKKWREVSTSLKKQTNYLDRLGYSKKIADIEFAIKELRQRNCLTEESINETILNTALVETRERIKKQDELQRYISDRRLYSSGLLANSRQISINDTSCISPIMLTSLPLKSRMLLSTNTRLLFTSFVQQS